MNSVPKLIPLFHNAGLRQLLDNKDLKNTEQSIFPDYGGVGLDISFDEGALICKSLKVFTDQVRFGARLCALPFMPPNSVETFYDPCLEDLQEKQNDLVGFCTGLKDTRKLLKTQPAYKEDLLSTYKQIKKLLKKEKLKDVKVRQNIVQLAQKYQAHASIPEENYAYVGGCLTTVNTTENLNVLLYPTGAKLNHLAIAPLEETQDVSRSFHPIESETRTRKLKGGKILQITSQSNGIAYVRQEHNLHFVNVGNSSKEMVDIPTILPFKMQDQISCVSPSPYIPSECVIVSSAGLVSLLNMEKNKPIWQSDYLTPSLDEYNNWWSCSFGSHPRSILCMDRCHLFTVDARRKKFEEQLLISSSGDFLLPDEKLFHVEKLHTSYYQHLVTTKNCLLVCDERYPKYPVMVWNHMLKRAPFYCKTATYSTQNGSSDIVVILGTQKSREVCAFFLHSSSTQVQPISLSPPLSLSSPTDSLESLKLHGIGLKSDMCHQRFVAPLVGVSVVPHALKLGFTTVQLTSLGDIFYQDFEKCLADAEKSYRSELGAVLCPPPHLISSLTNWIKDAALTTTAHKQKTTKRRIQVDLRELFDTNLEKSRDCAICYDNQETNAELGAARVCPSCGLSTEYARQLSDKAKELGVLRSLKAENVDAESEPPFWDVSRFETFTDIMSRKMLLPWWKEVEEVDDLSQNLSDYSLMSSLDASSNPTTPGHDSDGQSSVQRSMSQPISNISMSGWGDEEEDVIAPSQEVRSFMGETLRTPKKRKLNISLRSTAGF